MKISNLKINGIKNPIGYRFDNILCSWCVEDTKSIKQSKAKIEVSDVSDFRRILYQKEGKGLKQSGEKLDMKLFPRTTYYYRVTVVGDRKDSAVSETAVFETGKMNELWKAEWIAMKEEEKNVDMHPVFVKSFPISKPVRRARFYASGVGVFEAYLNGKKLGEEYLAPYLNDYESNIQAVTFLLDGLLEEENELKIMTGYGWYMGWFGLGDTNKNFGDKMAAIGELHIEYEDDTTECIITDDSWQYYGSDIESAGIYTGEIYNRLLWEGRENPIKKVSVVKPSIRDIGTKNLLISHIMDRLSLPLLVKEEVAVKKIIVTPENETILDMGQNFAGFMEFTADLPRGTKVVLEFGEILQHGNFYNKNYREAKPQFTYVSNGKRERVRAHFTYYGFRYVKVTGWPGEVDATAYTGKVLYSDLTRTGFIKTGNEKINRLYENTLWSMKSNFFDIPTDCPQRNERLGWTGDAQVFASTASYHMDTRAFYHKFLKDLRDEQIKLKGGVPNYVPNIEHHEDCGSVWGDAATLIPNTLFRFYGSLEEMECSYPLMKDWVDYITLLDEKNGKKGLFLSGFHFGDWLALDGITENSFKGGTDDGFIASVYYYHSAQIVAGMASRIGKQKEAQDYKFLYEKIKKAIQKEYFTPNGRLAVDTQTAYVIALKYDVCPNKERVIKQFRNRLQKDCYWIKTGFVGTPLLCSTLAENNMTEIAYRLLLREDYPGWLYCVNLGATTIWERWNSVLADGAINETGMNSLNHYAYGSVMEFIYAYAAGIRTSEPGFKRAIIAPNPSVQLKSLDCRYDSVNGTYICNWKIEKDGMFYLHIEVPFNCEAKVILPGTERENHNLAAGSYDFDYMPKNDFRNIYNEETILSELAEDQRALDILFKYVPAFGGIAAGKEAEMGAKSLYDLKDMKFIPHDECNLLKAIEEIKELLCYE